MLTNISEDKIFKYLSAVLIIASLIIVIMQVRGKTQPPIEPTSSFKTIGLNLEALKEIQSHNFLSYKEISAPKNIGRKNPFSPYVITEEITTTTTEATTTETR